MIQHKERLFGFDNFVFIQLNSIQFFIDNT